MRFFKQVSSVDNQVKPFTIHNLEDISRQVKTLGEESTSKVGAELLFDIISAAYERTSIVVTTNLPFENWTEVLGSERLTGAVLDRLTHRCHIIEMTGESYRLKDAKRRRTGKAVSK